MVFSGKLSINRLADFSRTFSNLRLLLSLLFLSNSFLVGDSAYEELIRDNKRKEDELRILHGKFLFSYTYALFVFI